MQKQAPSIGRIAVMAGFALSCFGLLLFLWVAFGGPVPLKPKGYRFTASFPEATQLAVEADVRISGVPVGKVKRIEVGKAGRTDAEIELEPTYAPIPRDARAILRQKTLLGETYVELTPGTPNSPKVPEGGRLAPAQVAPSVQLDEIFRAFDKPTRRAFQAWMQSQAVAIDGRGRDVSDALGSLAPLAEDANVLLEILNSQEGAVRRLVSNTGEVFAALTERDGQLRSLIENSNRVFRATAERDQRLRETFTVFPTFERESRTTLRRLDAFARNTNPLVTQLRPAARELSPTLEGIAELSPDLRDFFRELDPLIDASIDGLPALERLLDDLKPFLGELDAPLRNLTPIVDFLGRYRREAVAFFANTVAATQASDRGPTGTGRRTHYLRTMNPLNLENLAVYPERLPTNRNNPYTLPNHWDNYGRLESYLTEHCGPATGLPVLGPLVSTLLPAEIVGFLDRFATGATRTAAPPCIKQPKQRGAGDPEEVTDFPRVREEAP